LCKRMEWRQFDEKDRRCEIKGKYKRGGQEEEGEEWQEGDGNERSKWRQGCVKGLDWS